MLTSSAVFALLVFIHDLRLGCDANLIFKDPLKPKTENEIKDPIVGDGMLRKSPDLIPDLAKKNMVYESSNDAVVIVGTSDNGRQIMHEIIIKLGAATRVAFGFGFVLHDGPRERTTLHGIGNELDVAAGQKAVFRLSLLNEYSDNTTLEFFFDSVFKVPDNSWSLGFSPPIFQMDPFLPFIVFPSTVPLLTVGITQIKGIVFKASTMHKETGRGQLPLSGEIIVDEIISDHMTDADRRLQFQYRVTRNKTLDKDDRKFLLGVGVQEQDDIPVFVGIYFDGRTIHHQFEDYQQDVTEPIDVWMEYKIQDDYIEIKFYSTLTEQNGRIPIVQKLTYSSEAKPVRIFAHLGGIETIFVSTTPVSSTSLIWIIIAAAAAGVVIVAVAVVGYFCFFKKYKNVTGIYDHRMGFELEKTGKDTDANTVLEASSFMDH